MSDNENEEWIVTLVHPDEYVRNNNQVAGLSTQRVIYIKGKTLALKAFERIDYPLSNCHAISHRIYYDMSAAIGGGIALVLTGFIVWGLVKYGSEMEPGTGLRYGGIIAVAIFGWNRVSGLRRHEIRFDMPTEHLRWRSRPREFKSGAVLVDKVRIFAQERGLIHESFKQAKREPLV